MLERAKRVTRDGSTSAVEYARYADDLVVLVHEGRRWDWVLRAGAPATPGGVWQTQGGGERGEEPGGGPAQRGVVRVSRVRLPTGAEPMGPVAAAVYAAAHEAHGVAANAPGHFLAAPVSAGQWGGAAHQPHPARLGHLLCGGPIQSVFLVYLLLGRSRAAAALAAEPEASGLRVDSMALAAGLADGRGLSRLSRAPVSASSRFYSVGPITSDAKSAGKRSAGRSSQQGCNPAGGSPAMSIAHFRHVAIPHPGTGNRPGDAWCKRPGCSASRRCCGGCNLGV